MAALQGRHPRPFDMNRPLADEAHDPEDLPRLVDVVQRVGSPATVAAFAAMAAVRVLDLRLIDSDHLLRGAASRHAPALLGKGLAAAARCTAAGGACLPDQTTGSH